ncbi:MAG: YceI family protein [Cyclobacteriaceae bacterium]|nr:YceI family protein [Cyclobacteriaceae bacterium]
MKWRLFLGLFWVVALEGTAQKFVAEKSVITFFSDALLEDIAATNTKTVSIFNKQTGEVAFSVPISQFQFEKKLMQQHFNEKYMESEKYPKATFSGVLTNYDASASGVQTVKAKGKLTIHGVTREVEIDGTAEVGDRPVLKAKFQVKLADYKVEIPPLVFQNIAETVDVSIDITYKPQ